MDPLKYPQIPPGPWKTPRGKPSGDDSQGHLRGSTHGGMDGMKASTGAPLKVGMDGMGQRL